VALSRKRSIIPGMIPGLCPGRTLGRARGLAHWTRLGSGKNQGSADQRGAEFMGQEMVEAILKIEQEAAEQQDRAEKQAAALIAEANDEADAVLKEAREKAQQAADDILEEGKRAADAEQKRILDQAHHEADQLEQTAQDHLGDAVAYVVRRVSGRD
jgi:vacuolar-type H+-ATPase subunit H